MTPAHISYRPGALHLLDQTQLPAAAVFLELRSAAEVAAAIAQMRVRGAPAIGIAAAYGLAIAAHELAPVNLDDEEFLERLRRAAAELLAARPTAVNLAWAVNRLLNIAERQLATHIAHGAVAVRLDEEATKIHVEDVAACRQIGEFGAMLLGASNSKLKILTHCNTGDLATGGYGTALGIIRSAWRAGSLASVFVDETRPMLQGARLTVWELQQDGIPHTLITDSMAAHFMQRKQIDAVIVGADRIARNGDVANKIGTYALALAARAHDVPFVVAAPVSTFDARTPTGGDIIIEERSPNEVTRFAGTPTAPSDTAAANPAFDVTPAEYITAIVTERGILHPPYAESIAALKGTSALSMSPTS